MLLPTSQLIVVNHLQNKGSPGFKYPFSLRMIFSIQQEAKHMDQMLYLIISYTYLCTIRNHNSSKGNIVCLWFDSSASTNFGQSKPT
ncbi:hypothetical protein Ahy_B03g063064 isoform C [Arachis hypogaea]|uniref:Uncharacterized protein n=1 Tax=Arachis hypogaea TaxID=3818 RepID=A0A444ZWM3_ARAHY|nr:hypothetical protein Ahy_B03g063064 isoform C [Arachis hypogaea]